MVQIRDDEETMAAWDGAPMSKRPHAGLFRCRHGCHPQGRDALCRLCRHAVAAHEHALIDHHFENAQGPGLVQAAFVATDGGHVGRVFEGGATFFYFVA